MFAGLTASCWLDFRLQIIGVAMVSGVAIIAVLEHHFQTANAGRLTSENHISVAIPVAER